MPTPGVSGEAGMVGKQALEGVRLDRGAKQVHGQRREGNPHSQRGRRNRKRTRLGRGRGIWISEGAGAPIHRCIFLKHFLRDTHCARCRPAAQHGAWRNQSGYRC